MAIPHTNVLDRGAMDHDAPDGCNKFAKRHRAGIYEPKRARRQNWLPGALADAGFGACKTSRDKSLRSQTTLNSRLEPGFYLGSFATTATPSIASLPDFSVIASLRFNGNRRVATPSRRKMARLFQAAQPRRTRHFRPHVFQPGNIHTYYSHLHV